MCNDKDRKLLKSVLHNASFFGFLNPLLLFYCSHHRISFKSWLLELTSSIATKQFVLCDNFVKKPTMLWKTPNENGIREHLQVTKERLRQSEMLYSLKAFHKVSYI